MIIDITQDTEDNLALISKIAFDKRCGNIYQLYLEVPHGPVEHEIHFHNEGVPWWDKFKSVVEIKMQALGNEDIKAKLILSAEDQKEQNVLNRTIVHQSFNHIIKFFFLPQRTRERQVARLNGAKYPDVRLLF